MIGILNAYHFDPTADGKYQEEYTRLFIEFVKSAFPEQKNEVKEYKVAQGQFPASVFDCDLWFITGSPKSVYDDLPWVHQLTSFTQELHKNRRKLIGVCFGHQMVAHALGGKVSKSPKGWGVGIRDFQVTQRQPWMNADDKNISLIFSHQDQVDQLAPGAELLATDEFCPNQVAQIGSHILSFQGHPEFSEAFAKDRLVSRKDKMPLATFETAMNSFGKKNDYEKLANWIRNFAKLT